MTASHPSGSVREDVELVNIETDKLTLIIKGKPFHERYVSLKQYRQMDFHESMKFFVEGEGIKHIKVFNLDTMKLDELTTCRPIFFENGIYQLLVSPKGNQEFSFYHEHPLLRKDINPVHLDGKTFLMGPLRFQNEIGFSTFEIREGNKVVLEVNMEIFPSKLDYKQDYKSLISEVNDEIYNLAFHFIKKTYLGASISKQESPSRSEFYRLLTYYFNSLIKAVQRIEKQPHHQLVGTYDNARGDQLGRIDHKGIRFLRKRPHLFQEVAGNKGITIDDRNLMPISGLRIKKEMTFDTLENRFVKWMIERIVHKIEDLLQKLQSKKRFEIPLDSELIEQLTRMKKRLSKMMNNLFWNQMKHLDRSVMSLVIQMAPGYRDMYQIFLILSNGLTLQESLQKISVKDVATLYEYWTYLKIGQLLNKKYDQISQDIVKVTRKGLFVNLDTSRSAKRIFRHPITHEKITLIYQKYEGNLPTIPQKPDTTLMIEKKGKDYQYHFIFDAKYKIDFALEGSSYKQRYQQPGPMEEDINTMHRYRDSLVILQDGPYEKKAFGAYVLFPWFDEDSYTEHHFYKSINEVNIGGLPFLPNATQLLEQFITRLIEKTPEEIQREGILPLGTLQEWNSSLDEKVLVGMVPRKENLEAHLKHGFYHIPVRELKKGWQAAKYIALYPKYGVWSKHGIINYAKITDVKFVNRKDIIELPSNKTEGYVRFEVGPWTDLKEVIKPVGYGISVYMLTTFQTLKEAKELPELFMKQKEEVILWRMLRRVSNKVHFDLDAKYLDLATKIERYRFKDIEIKVDYVQDQVLVKRTGTDFITNKSIPIADLVNHPSMVFKQLINVME